MNKLKKDLFFGLVVGFILTIFFLYNIVLNINKSLSLDYLDPHQYSFTIKHNLDVILSGKLQNIFTLPMFYGFHNSLFFQNLFFTQTVFSMPIYLLTGRNIIITYNLLIIFSSIMVFYSMYLLVYYLTKNRMSALISATIFAFNPYVAVNSGEVLDNFTLAWLPLLFLFFERWLKNPRGWGGFFFFIILLAKFFSFLYTFGFTTVVFPIYMIVRFWQEKISPLKLISLKSIAGFIFFIIPVLLTGLTYVRIFHGQGFHRTLEEVSLYYSPFVANWFLMPLTNLIYGRAAQTAFNSWPDLFTHRHFSDMNTFWGIVPIILFILSFVYVRKTPQRKYWAAFLFILILSFLFSLGPRVQFTNKLFLPGPYILVYVINPLFKFMRVANRFAGFVFLFLSLIVGLTFAEISKRIPIKKISIVAFIIVILIMIEYLNKPLNFMTPSSSTLKFYSFLQKQKKINVIIDIPTGYWKFSNGEIRRVVADSKYLYWQQFHNKALFNGYGSFIPQAYIERMAILGREFPNLEDLNI